MLYAGNVDGLAVDDPWFIFEFQRGLRGGSLEQAGPVIGCHDIIAGDEDVAVEVLGQIRNKVDGVRHGEPAHQHGGRRVDYVDAGFAGGAEP